MCSLLPWHRAFSGFIVMSDGWIGWWIDWLMDGLMDGLIDGWIGWWMDWLMDGLVDGWIGWWKSTFWMDLLLESVLKKIDFRLDIFIQIMIDLPPSGQRSDHQGGIHGEGLPRGVLQMLRESSSSSLSLQKSLSFSFVINKILLKWFQRWSPIPSPSWTVFRFYFRSSVFGVSRWNKRIVYVAIAIS